MTPLPKILIGGVATAALAGLVHFAMGQAFIDHLTQTTAEAVAIAGRSNVSVKFDSNPLRRIAALSGPVTDPAERDKLLQDARAVPGVADAYWADNGALPVKASATAEPPATAERVRNCQNDVDAVVAGKTISFASGTAALTADGASLIDALATKLAPCNGTAVEVAGHTDATGSPAHNQILAEARAKTVVAALAAKGVPAARLIAKGYGSSKPLVAGTDAAANRKNRRIEFTVMAVK
jgi:outer membrane protein OmpA-like peptidoglycan-associated protein